MKKKRIILGSVLLTLINLCVFSYMVKADSDHISHAGGDGEGRAAYCQVFGNRTGCVNDPSRTCHLMIFCN